MVVDLPQVSPRLPESHKGSFGRVVIVAGSRGMSGAAILAGSAALRSGAGLVTVATPASVQAIVAGAEPSYMTLPLPDDADGRLKGSGVRLVLDRSWDALAIGPGLGQSPGVDHFVREILTHFRGPMVIDADALNALSRWKDCPAGLLSQAILTPHAGEYQRLMEADTHLPIADRPAAAGQLQDRTGAVIVLKGAGTVIANAEKYRINSTGNPGLATGGTGDVLTGMLVGLLGQGWSTWEAGILGVHLHGRAGDIVAQEKGEISLIARDLLEAIPRAFIEQTRSPRSTSH
jgi:NAD(P)H-hydrate epimerase